MSTKTKKEVTGWTSGYCNPYQRFDQATHDRCLVVAGTLTCACACHAEPEEPPMAEPTSFERVSDFDMDAEPPAPRPRYAVFWVGLDDEPQMENGWSSEWDANLYLAALATHGLREADSPTSVDAYVGECPW